MKPITNIEAVLLAVGDMFAEEQKRYEGQLRDAIADALTKIEPGQPGEPGRDSDPAQVAARFLEMVETNPELADSLKGRDGKSPDGETIAALVKSDPLFLAATKGEKGDRGDEGRKGDKGDRGEKGIDADPNEVAEIVKSDPEFRASMKGEKGDRGDEGRKGDRGEAADPLAVADLIMQNAAFVEKVSPQPLHPADVVERLLESEQFDKTVRAELDRVVRSILSNDEVIAKLRAPAPDIDLVIKGAAEAAMADPSFVAACQGKAAEPDEVAHLLIENPDFIALTKGADADPKAVAKALALDAEFCKSVRGADSDPFEVAGHIVKTPFFKLMVEGSIKTAIDQAVEALRLDEKFTAKLRGEKGDKGDTGLRGQDADPEDVAKALAEDEAFLARAKGPQGDKGDKGEDAEPVDLDAVAALLKSQIIDDEAARLSFKGDRGEPGTDAPVIEPFVIRAGQNYAKNGIGIWDGGLWIAKKIAYGTPDDDPTAWQNVCNGLASVKAKFDGTLRQHVYEIKRSDGSTYVYKVDDAPRHVPDEASCYIPGDWFIERSAAGAVNFGMLWAGEVRKFDLRGEKGETGDRGRKGARGEPGNGFLDIALTDTGALVVTMDDGKQFEIDTFGEVFEQKELSAMVKHVGFLRRTIFGRSADISQPVVNFRGQWKVGDDYDNGDIVQDAGNVYIAKGRTTAELHNGDAWIRLFSAPPPARYLGPKSVTTEARDTDHHLFDFGDEMPGPTIIDLHVIAAERLNLHLSFLSHGSVIEPEAALHHSGRVSMDVGAGLHIRLKMEVRRIGDHVTLDIERTSASGSITRSSHIFPRKEFPTCGGIAVTATGGKMAMVLAAARVE